MNVKNELSEVNVGRGVPDEWFERREGGFESVEAESAHLLSPRRRKQAGVTFITIVLGIAIAGLVVLISVDQFNEMLDNIDGQAAGQQMMTVSGSAGNYFLANGRKYEDFHANQDGGIDWGGQNALGGHVCAYSTFTVGTACTAATMVAAATDAAAATPPTLTLVYTGFDSQPQCETALHSVRGMPYFDEATASSGCVASLAAEQGGTDGFRAHFGLNTSR